MSSIDDRVVHMSFDNAQFESGVKQTTDSLSALNKSLKLEGATKGLTDVSAAANGVKLGHIATAVDEIAGRFKAMSVVAITALATIAHQAVLVGGNLVKSLTIDPIKSGLDEYETNLNSIQTILSNTQWENTGLDDVNEALRVLNEYSDKTIYNFGEMARNIGTFTAAGVSLDVATEAIKGIANLAAVSGSNAQQASTAMYQLSQALAAGKVTLMDWNSVVNAGMGGKVFQDALMETARIHGVAVDKMVKEAGSFRSTLENGWLTGEILTETLAKFTGDLSEAQLKSMGYNKDQIAGIIRMGQTAQDAATKIKTFSQLLNTLQEAAGSGWSKTWQLIFGDFEEAKSLFTGVYDVLGGFIEASADARNKVLGDWKELGGRKVIIEAISLAFNDLMEILVPIGKAFRDVFPATTGQRLYEITVAIRDFFSGARLGEDTMDNLRRTFAGLFSILGIGWDIVKRIASVFFDLIGMMFDGSGSFLEITANIGDFLVALRKAINDGEGLNKFFSGLKAVLSIPIKLIGQLTSYVAKLFDGFDATEAVDNLAKFTASLNPLTGLGETVAYVWDKVVSVFGRVWDMFAPLASKFAEFFSQFNSGVGGLNLQDLLGIVNTGLIATLVIALTKIFGRQGILDQARGIIDGLTGTLGAMQNTLRAATLLQIALAVGVLAAAVLVLSQVDAAGLSRALTSLGVMFTQLIGALIVLEKFGTTNVLKVMVAAATLSALAVAVGILAISVKQLSELDWQELARGLVGVTALLAAVVAAVKFMPPSAGLVSTAAGLVILSAGIKILASAVKDLSGLGWEEMSKGLVGVGAILASLSLFTKFAQVNAGGILAGAGLILIAAGIKILASAIADLSVISWENVGKGLAIMAVSLGLISAALVILSDAAPTAILSAASILIVAASLGMIADAVAKMGGMSWADIGAGLVVLATALTLITAALVVLSDFAPTAPLSAAAILIVALSLGYIADAVKKMGSMSWEEIAKGLVTLAGALLIIGVAVTAMSGAIPGALALIIVSGALTILTAVLLQLGNMSWGEILKGLGALALAFTVLGVAAALLTPVIPAMLGLGIAIALIGAGLALAGAGVFLFAAGLTALSIAGAAGTAAIVALVSAVIGMIPMLVEQLGLALILLIKIIAEAAPEIVAAVVKIIVALIDGIAKIAPKLVKAVVDLLILLLDAMIIAIPKFVDAGLKIVLGILKGIRDNIGKIVTVATEVIQAYLKAVGDNLPKVIQSGVDLIFKFIKGITKAIDDNSEKLGKAGADLGIAIIRGMIKGLNSGIGQIINAARNVAQSALNAAMDVLGINSPATEFIKVGKFSDEGLAIGLDKYSHLVEKSAAGVADIAMETMRNTLSGMSEAISSEVDTSPTIAPVLDLAQFRRDASQIPGALASNPLQIGVTSASATTASVGVQENAEASATTVSTGDTFQFTQNNTSPKALSAAEIYRNTKNQLSVAKGALAA